MPPTLRGTRLVIWESFRGGDGAIPTDTFWGRKVFSSSQDLCAAILFELGVGYWFVMHANKAEAWIAHGGARLSVCSAV